MKAAIRKARQELHGKTNQRVEKVLPYPSAKAYEAITKLLLEGDYKSASNVLKNLKSQNYGFSQTRKQYLSWRVC